MKTIQISNHNLYALFHIVVILLTSSFIVHSKWMLVMSGKPSPDRYLASLAVFVILFVLNIKRIPYTALPSRLREWLRNPFLLKGGF